MQLPRANNGFWELLFHRVIVIELLVLNNVLLHIISSKLAFEQVVIPYSCSVYSLMLIV